MKENIEGLMEKFKSDFSDFLVFVDAVCRGTLPHDQTFDRSGQIRAEPIFPLIDRGGGGRTNIEAVTSGFNALLSDFNQIEELIKKLK